MIHALCFLMFLVGFVVSVSVVTLDPVTMDIDPVHNARVRNKTSNLYGTNFVGLYKLTSLSGDYKQDVIVENINDTNPSNKLYCERTHENAFMSMFIKISTGQLLVCMEKFAELPITLYCQPYFSRRATCNNLYIKRHTVPLVTTKFMATTTTAAFKTPLTTAMLTNELKPASSNFNLLKLPPEAWYLITATFIFGCFVLALCCCIIVMIITAVTIKNHLFTKFNTSANKRTSLDKQNSRNSLLSEDYVNRNQAIDNNNYIEEDIPLNEPQEVRKSCFF